MLAFRVPARFTADDVKAIASLARVELDPAEIELFARQLGDVLAYANEVQAVETADVAPTAYVTTHGESERADIVQQSLTREAALLNAPEASPEAGLFKVPRVIG